MLEISRWWCSTVGRPVEVDSDQIKTLIGNNQCYIPWEGENWQTQNIQISKAINENEKCLVFYGKN